MSYASFLLVFILPIIGVLAYLQSKNGTSLMPRWRLGIVLMAALALLYTTPWDNYLIYRGVWSYSPDRVWESWRLGYVPLEEYLFFVLQPVMTGLFLLYFTRQHQSLVAPWFQPQPRSRTPRVVGGLIALLLTGIGVWAVQKNGQWTYFGLILAWAGPVLALQWVYGGDYLWRARRIFFSTLVTATVYLWVVDRIAIEWKIWSISPQYSTGWHLLGLPWEEAIFFLVTNLLVIQGLLLFFHVVGSRQTAQKG
jgi:lycopene beta-cyclase